MKQLKITTNLNKNEKYILTCSFGPDSMALFRYLLDNNFDFEVAHVNYHILAQADSDCRKIVEFSRVFGKKVHILSTHMPKNVNEEERAREVRYSWFEHLAEITEIKNILVAHNKGDDLETFIMQKEKGVHLHYGIKEILERKNCRIIRPLLKYSKLELTKFCEETNTPYSIDPSNFDPSFYRNKIRLELKELSEQKIEELMNEKARFNAKNEETLNKYYSCFDEIYGFNFKKALLEQNLTEDELHIILLKYVSAMKVNCEIGANRVHEIYLKATNVRGVSFDKLDDIHNLFYEYGFLKIDSEHKPYSFDFDSNEIEEYFEIDYTQLEEFKKLNSFKILIKNCSSAGFLNENGQKKPLNKLFSKMKLPLSLRDIWPGIFNENNELIYVPRFRKDFKTKGLITPNLKNLENLKRIN